MNPTELKSRLAKLWKDTFHDTDEYISLVFNNYFDPELVAYEESGGDVVAGLIGVPYEFGNAELRVRGLYLCGLATRPQFRSRGIMTRLLARINEVAREKGFVFTFLIPADEGLRKYYRDRDYVNAFYRVVDNYTSLHDFDREYESVLLEQKEKVADLKRRYYASLKTGFLRGTNKGSDGVLDGIKTLIRSIENTQRDLQIIHSDRDIELLIAENGLSGGVIHYVLNPQDEVTAVAFTSVSDGEVKVHKLFTADMASRFKVLGSVKATNRELSIAHYVPSIEMDRKALWSRTYGSVMTDARQVPSISVTERVYSLAAHSRVYGMARILDFPEVLKFQADTRHDLKYSILVKAPDVYTYEQIDVRDGKLKLNRLPADSIPADKTAHVMTRRDIGEILFRRRDTDNMITEAFGIPSINGAISLMLD